MKSKVVHQKYFIIKKKYFNEKIFVISGLTWWEVEVGPIGCLPAQDLPQVRLSYPGVQVEDGRVKVLGEPDIINII